MSSTIGTLFRATTFGESHGPAVGVIVDGCPSQLPLSEADVQIELDRRRPGQSKLVTQRKESDRVEILSGVLDGQTLGTPIAMLVRNEDARSRDYEELRTKYRPSHADFAYDQKYGVRAWSGGGRASARETVGRVAAGAVAQVLLQKRWGVEVESNPVRCPDAAAAQSMTALIEEVRKQGDSVGGIVCCVAKGVPSGWGEPVFDKLEADLAKAVISIPACKGFEVGSGFAGTRMTGTEHNDPFRSDDGQKA